MNSPSHPVKTQAPSPNIRRSQDGKLSNVFSWFNITSYMEKPIKTRKKRQQSKNTSVPKKTFYEPTKMKQVWVSKSTSPELETKPIIGDRKKHWNKKSPGKKKRVLNPQVSCSTSNQNFLGVGMFQNPFLNGFLRLFVDSEGIRETTKSSTFIFRCLSH